MFTLPVETHEETHVFQLSRNPEVLTRMEENLASGKIRRDYDYGGMEGLLQAHRDRKTITDFGPEQQAEMVRDFQEKTQEAFKKHDPALLDKVNEAYGPYIRQLAGLPGKNELMTVMTQKDLTPPAPGLPPAVETGILAEDKLLGSKMEIIPPKGYRLETHAALQR